MFLTNFRGVFLVLAMAGAVLAQDKATTANEPVTKPAPTPIAAVPKPTSGNFISDKENFSIALPAAGVMEANDDDAGNGTTGMLFEWQTSDALFAIRHGDMGGLSIDTALEHKVFHDGVAE